MYKRQVQLWNRLASNYEAILLPLLSVLKAVPGDPAQERELEDLEKRIQELKKQSHMLRKVLADGNKMCIRDRLFGDEIIQYPI